MKILITGANGAIGSDLVDFFSKNNKVIALYRTSNFISNKFRDKNIRWFKQDLRKKISHKIGPKILIHCVAAHPFSKKSTYLNYLESNIIALKNVIEFAKRQKIEKFFYLSSIKIYGDIQSKIHKDCNVFVNPDILGATKILAEKMLELQKFNYLNIRLPGVLCYKINDFRRPWLNYVINRLRKNKIVNIYNSSGLFNNVIDTFEIFRLINYLGKKKKIKNGSLNFAARKPIKIKKMIFNLKRKLSSKSKIVFKKEKSKHFILSTNKTINDYRFRTADTSTIINRYIDKYKSL